MSKLDNLIDKIRDSEVIVQLRSKYDDLDTQTKSYVNYGALGIVTAAILGSVLFGVGKVNAMKRDLNEREELIGYLQRTADQIKQLKAQQMARDGNSDTTSPLNMLIDGAIQNSGIDRAKADLGPEKQGTEEKELSETILDVKLSQINVRQLNRLLFNLTERGTARSLNIKNLTLDTKGDASGYLDATFTVATYRAK